ncbi:uncharacterized protein LOC135845645 isoform X2 [Planococcus citri]|uniref:uncharacterized protein LOC135845645 isoform X2 n=1 Tax=Planococcus citri TaxID=170843 RepID=UPI0031F72EA3
MDDVEYLLPSEIARLIYGHLKATESEEVSNKFLNECPELSECRELHKQNRTFKTKANGMTLKEILDQYMSMHEMILGTVNQLVGKSQQFTDPVEALNYLMSDNSKIEQSSADDNIDDQHSPGGHSSSCDEDLFSDFSLNLKTPDKHKSREKVTKNIPETLIELSETIDKSIQETTPESNKPPSRPGSDVIIRQSTRLQLKKQLKNDRSCNSDSIKELRVNPNDDCDTPHKVGNPPYSENKLWKPRAAICLLSSDSEPESTSLAPPVIPVTKPPSAISERLNGFFENATKKKTIKTMKPRRPPSCTPSCSSEKPAKSEKKCKRNRIPAKCGSKNSTNERKKSKLTVENDKPPEAAASDVKKLERKSDEFVFTSDVQQAVEKPKMRRKSGPVMPSYDEKWGALKLNKSLSVIDDVVLGERLIKNKKLQEHIAANINEVITNSPQKKIGEVDPIDFEELIKTSLEKVIADPVYQNFESDVLDELIGQAFNPQQSCSDVSSQPESTRNQANLALEINADTQISTDANIDIDDPLAANNEEVIQSTEHEQNPAIIIEIREDQITTNQETYIEKHTPVSEEFRSYFSNIPGIESSPDTKLGNALKSDENASVINLVAPNGEITESCKVGDNTAERIVYSGNSILFPFNEGIPMVTYGRSAEFQICGTPSSLTQVSRKNRFVTIAPKPNNGLLMENSTDLIKAQKKRRTRGGKRP